MQGRGYIPGRGKRHLFSAEFRPALEPNQLSLIWVSGGHSQAVKRPGSGADHSPAYSAEVMNGGAILHSLTRHHGVVLN
jgi:hypothetical protein